MFVPRAVTASRKGQPSTRLRPSSSEKKVMVEDLRSEESKTVAQSTASSTTVENHGRDYVIVT